MRGSDDIDYHVELLFTRMYSRGPAGPGSHTKHANLRYTTHLLSHAMAKKGKEKQRPPANGRGPAARKVMAPVAKGSVRTMRKPQMSNLSTPGDIRVVHREYIADLTGSAAFASNAFAVNPGLVGTFPWLSQIARRFESYRFRKLRFSFETESATTQTGVVLGALDFDASDAAPESKQQAMAYRNSVRSPPWSDFDFNATAEDLRKRASYYVRNGSLSANQDIKLYDTGNFFCCTSGNSVATLGELYVEYDVDLMTPQMGPAGAGDAESGVFNGTSNAAPAATKTGNLPATAVSTGTTTSVTTFTFSQPWEGLVAVTLAGTVLTGTTAGGSATVTTVQDVVNAGATNDNFVCIVRAIQGQTLVITVGNTTITAAGFQFGQGDF